MAGGMVGTYSEGKTVGALLAERTTLRILRTPQGKTPSADTVGYPKSVEGTEDTNISKAR